MIRILLLVMFLAASLVLPAQDTSDSVKVERKVVQLTGLVVEGDSMYGLPFVNVFVPNTPRGTVTNSMGYFSMAVYETDTVEIDMIGYRKERYPIPVGGKDNLSIIIHLVPDTSVMAVVDIYPYPDLDAFTNAFMTAELHKRDIENMKKNLNERLLRRMLYYQGMDGSMNHKYFTEQHVVQQETQYMYPTIPLLDPFAWVRFFKDIKKYKENKEKGHYDYLDD